MKKWVIVCIGCAATMVWAATLIVFILAVDSAYSAKNHSAALSSSVTTRAVSNARMANHFKGEQSMNGQGITTIIGNHEPNQAWIEDIQDNGKLSIDTLLDELNLNETELNNS